MRFDDEKDKNDIIKILKEVGAEFKMFNVDVRESELKVKKES